MAYEFKKLSDVDVVAEPTESANVLIEENGVIKKAPKTAVGDSVMKMIYFLHGQDNIYLYTDVECTTKCTANELRELSQNYPLIVGKNFKGAVSDFYLPLHIMDFDNHVGLLVYDAYRGERVIYYTEEYSVDSEVG